MQIIAIKEIDLSNYIIQDLEFYHPRGKTMYLETNEVQDVSIRGHNILSDTYYIMPIVEKETYDVITNINGTGTFDVDISSVDKVSINVIGNKGKMFIKIVA